ncbi:acyloxyacyl hydrolase [Maribacter spongiicola]|uniref:acyloxyacyl hydrolase n=1 Tax=Maribacter spongiicola TaxID=1206753 RepID=UPI003F9B9EB4
MQLNKVIPKNECDTIQKIPKQFLLVITFLISFHVINAQHNFSSEFYKKGGKIFSLGFEHVSGFNTSLECYSLRAGYGSMLLKNLTVFSFLDLSTTNGFQVIGSDENLLKTRQKSFGLGTSFLLRWYLLHSGKIKMFIDVGGGILYTFERFPYQGTKLNFTARPGVGIAMHFDDNKQIVFGINRFHLSNGLGYNHPSNPAFDGLGLFASIVIRKK